MKRKSEIRNMLQEYKLRLESTKTEIADVAMNGDIEYEEKNKKLTKIEPIYKSYALVVDVLEDILEVSLENKDDELDSDSEIDEVVM